MSRASAPVLTVRGDTANTAIGVFDRSRPKRARAADPAALLLVVAAAAGCGRGDSGRDKTPPPAEVPLELPARLPSKMPVDQYVGAEACRPCHEQEYEQWRKSPHGRAMARAESGTVLGAFDGVPVEVPGGIAVPVEADGQYRMRLEPEGQAAELHDVEIVLAAGRQQQTYLTHTDDGELTILPLFWATRAKRWLSTDLYAAGNLEPGTNDHWRNAALLRLGCTNCHLSQGHLARDGDRVEVAWVDLSVNCEACHGPGRVHVAKRKAGEVDDTYRDLHAISKREDAVLCGQCHGRHQPFYLPADEPWNLRKIYVTLADSTLRPDGTQQQTAYQLAGHLLSRCYIEGGMTCSSCHGPHDALARSHVGESAVGDQSDLQCTVCHRNYREAAAATRHSHHPSKVFCVDCHMSYSWIEDSSERQQRTSDHSISIPRPIETIEIGTPNACNTCHGDRDPGWALEAVTEWGQQAATKVRPWVQTVAKVRRGDKGMIPALIELIERGDREWFLRISALELVARQDPDRRAVPVLERFQHSDDPQERAAALVGLLRHDGARTGRWIEQALGDPHPYVRYIGLQVVRDARWIDDETMTRLRDDALAYHTKPFQLLAQLADTEARRNKPKRGLALLDRVAEGLSDSQELLFGIAQRRAGLRKFIENPEPAKPR